MNLLDAATIAAAGGAAGLTNAVAGGGSLLSFPALVAAGYTPVAANVTNTVALWPGYLAGTVTHRQELGEQRHRLPELLSIGAAGGVAGTVLLLRAPPGVFKAVVPFLVLAAVALLALQPRLASHVERRRAATAEAGQEHRDATLRAAIFGAAVYGAYFGGALGVILVATLGTFLGAPALHVNGLKNALSFVINTVALVGFAVFGPVAWEAVVVVGPASLLGGAVGGRLARRLSPVALRRVVIVYGTLAALRLLTT